MASSEIKQGLAALHRWHPAEIAFWLLAFSTYFLLPGMHNFLNEVAILALFAISLDLILGYAGIVSLGHGAFLGLAAYSAGLFAKHVHPDPLVGLAVATAITTLVGFVSSFLVLRGNDLTRLMITIGVTSIFFEIANQMSDITGGADGLQGVEMSPLLGVWRFDMFGRTAYAYSLITLFIMFLIARRITNSSFGMSLRAIRDNPLRAAAIGIPVNRRLIAIYTIAAAFAGVAGALQAQTAQFVGLDVLSFEKSADVMLVLVIGGAGYLYGGIIGALVFKILQDWLSWLTPQYWHFWIGLILVIIVLIGRDRISNGVAAVLAPFRRLLGRAQPSPQPAAGRPS
jgi:branched-chain amino acid transport system permease protein